MSVLSTATHKQIEDQLVAEGLITAGKLKELKENAQNNNTPFFSLLVDGNYVSNETLTKVTAHVTKLPYVDLTEATINPKSLALLPQELAERYMAVVLGEIEGRLAVAMLDADNVQAVDFLANKLGRSLRVYTASETGIRRVIKQYANALAGQVAEQVAGVLETPTDSEEPATARITDKHKSVKTIVQDSPISKALSTILEYAAKNRASDVHIEPFENELKIRCRIDGVLAEIMKLPKSIEPPLVSRVKILANLKIDEHRIPQDGQFTVHVAERDIDLRIAISPVVWGEQVVIRLLDKYSAKLELETMGYIGPALAAIRKGLKQPNGMILTSGPTGSGKTTSMYALIQEIKNDTINIVTLEDPVEYKMAGVNQIQVNPDVGLTFGTGLRSILRQDPDVVMVGEIRDKETANLAVQAALTGHLVFSTLHTNSAAGILPRLLDMGVEPFLIASTVHTIIGQRLVRRLDDNKETYESDAVETEAIHLAVDSLLPVTDKEVKAVAKNLGYESLPLKGQSAYTLFKGHDSLDAPGGYKGRVGLYEVIEVTDAIRQMILKREPSTEIQKIAVSEGMVPMYQDGYLKALAGYTTLAEVNRVAAIDSA